MTPFLLAAAGVAAMAYLPLTAAPAGALRSLVKTAPLALFAGVASIHGAPGMLVLGLALSAAGDFALSRAGERAFLAGLCAFALAHLAYIGLFLEFMQGWPLWPTLVLGVLALSTERWLAPYTGSLRWPVRIYVLLICLMGATAFGLPSSPGTAALGAGCFIASDILLAVQLFRLPQGGAAGRRAGYALWVLYVSGQALILLAFGSGATLS